MNKPTPPHLRIYRQRHRRLDYYPSHDVMDIIAFHQANSTEPCIAGILDGLIRAGHRILSGKVGNG